MGHEDRRRPRHRHLPGPQLRHAQDHHRRRRHRLGDATLNGRELAVPAYLRDHVVPAADRPRPRAHRGHLAVPLPGRLLAPRPGDDDRDRRRRHGAVGHQGQGRRPAGLPAARRAAATASWSTATPAATTSTTLRTTSRATSTRATRRSARRPRCPGWPAPTASRADADASTSRPTPRCRRRRLGDRAYLASRRG